MECKLTSIASDKGTNRVVGVATFEPAVVEGRILPVSFLRLKKRVAVSWGNAARSFFGERVIAKGAVGEHELRDV